MVEQSLAVVLVTYNRCALLQQSLDALAKQNHLPTQVIVVNNASTDDVTTPFLDNYTGSLSLQVIHNPQNTGGAGGFFIGVKTAFEQGFEWIFLMDDDVLAEPDCLAQLMQVGKPCMIAVREYKDGSIVERAALHYDLANPFVLSPKRASVDETYTRRADMPRTFQVENVAFEGFMIHRDVVAKIGYPNADYFIFYDDVDYALRARQAGFDITAVRDAILVRQLPFDQAGAVNSWKAFYMFRNLFHIHYKYGENVWVRYKPYVLALGAMVVYGLKFCNLNVVHQIYQAIKNYKNLIK